MNLDELRSTQEKERRKDSLQHLRDSFYEHVAAYIADLRASRDRRAERINNPFADEEISQLSDEIDTAEDVAEALYERRVGKVVKLASFAAADMPVDEEGMTALERALYEDLVARIKQNKQDVLNVLAGEGPTEQVAPANPTKPAETAAPADSAATARTVSPEESTVTGEPAASAGGVDQPAASSDRPDESRSSPTASDHDPSAPDHQEDGGMLADAMRSQSDAESTPPGGNANDDPSPNSARLTEGGADSAPEIKETDAEQRDGPGQPTQTPGGDASTGDSLTEGSSDETSESQPVTSHPSTDGGAVSTSSEPTSEVDTSTGGPNPDVSPDQATDTSGFGDTPGSSETVSGAPHEGRTTTVSTESMDSTSRQPPESGSDTSDTDSQPDATARADGSPSAAAEKDSSPTVDERITVRITSDVGDFLGVDEREYDLSSEDVVTLPELNAKPLLDRDAATRID